MRRRLGFLLAAAMVLCSCGGKEPSAAQEGEAGEAYEVVEPDLPADASPTQVAEALFAALDADDGARLLGLAARRTITAELNRIGWGRLRFSETKAVGLAVAGWGATYAFIEPGSTTTTEERIADDRASVFADCRNDADGTPRGLKVELAREEEGWRVSRLVPMGAVPPQSRRAGD